MKQSATLIGDIVGSRVAADRTALHRRLADVLARATEELRPVVPFRLQVGDEYQARFATVGEALQATLWLRLELDPDVDVRHGVGWGGVEVFDEEPRVEDGPGWWVARDAIEHVKAEAGRAALRLLRTAYRRAEGIEGPDPASINAALVCRDHLVGSVAARSLRLLRGSLAGRSQRDLAAEEGISASAVSQRVRHDGLAAILAAHEMLGDVS